MATKIYSAPKFVAVRTVAGALAADAVIINDTNYPQTASIQPHGCWPTIIGNWYAGGGTVLPTDWLDVQVLYRDARGQWIEGPTAHGVRQNEEFALPLRDCTEVYLRVPRVLCASGTGLVLMAATSRHAVE